MRYTFELFLNYSEGGSSQSLQVRELLSNWDDVQLAFKRADYDGVVRSFSTSFDFVGAAREVLITRYLADGIGAAVSIVFKTLQEDNTYSDLFSCALDFTTFSYNDYTATISAVDASTEAVIKAKKSTKYDLQVEGLPTNWLDYEGMPSMGCGVFKAFSRIEMATTTTNSYYGSLAMAFDYDKLPGYGESNAFFAEDGTAVYIAGSLADIDGESVFTTKTSTTANVLLDFTIRVSDTGGSGVQSVTVGVAKTSSVGVGTAIMSKSVSVGVWTRVRLEVSAYGLQELDGIVPYVRNGMGKSLLIEVQPTANNVFKVEYTSKNGAAGYFPIVGANDIGVALLRKMLGTNAVLFTVDTQHPWWRYSNVFSTSCINRGSDGVISTSWADFTEWAKTVFGLVVEITTTANGIPWVRLCDRGGSAIFDTSSVRSIDEYTEFECRVQKNLIYSEVNVGYDKSDIIDAAASEDFCNGIENFTTGAKNIEKVLNLKSPYRCSPWQIEQAVRERSATDENAGDVYFVAATLKPSQAFDAYDFALINKKNYPTQAPTVSGCMNNTLLFNAMFSPRTMMLANLALVAPCCKSLAFASFDGNAKATVDGALIASDIRDITGVYTADEVSVETADNTIYGTWNGLFTVEEQGRLYSGFIKDVAFSVAHPEKVKYTFIVREISEI